MKENRQHKVVVVLGAKGYLGSKLCYLLAELGWLVVAACRCPEGSKMHLTANINVFDFDLGKLQDRAELVECVQERYGGWDLIIDVIGEMVFDTDKHRNQVVHLMSTARAGFIAELMQRGGMRRGARVYASVPAMASLQQSTQLGAYARGQQQFTSRLRQLGVDFGMQNRVHLMVIGRIRGGIWKNVRGLKWRFLLFMKIRLLTAMSPTRAAMDIIQAIKVNQSAHLYIGSEAADAYVDLYNWLIQAAPDYLEENIARMDSVFAGCRTVHRG